MAVSLQTLQKIEYIKTLLMPVYRLFQYILKHPLKSIWWLIRAYLLIVIFVILLVLSLSANANGPVANEELKEAKYINRYTSVVTSGYVPSQWTDMKATSEGDNGIESCGQVMNKIESADFTTSQHDWVWKDWYRRSCYQNGGGYARYTVRRCVSEDFGVCSRWTNSTHDTMITGVAQNDIPICPPDLFPDYTVPKKLSTGTAMCAKPQIEKDDGCPKLSSDALPEMYFSIDMTKTEICFQNPVNAGEQCKYSGQNGFFQTPNMGNLETQDCETKQPINDILPPPDNEGCRVTSNGKVCPDNPNDRCKTTSTSVGATGATGSPDYQLSCDAGCGMIKGEFMCVPVNNETPIEGCNSAHYRELNPSVCKTDPTTTDKNQDGVTDSKDVVSAINSNNAVSESMLDSLNRMSETLEKSDEKGFEGNKLLSAMNGKLGEIDGNVKKIADAIGGDSTGETGVVTAELSEKLKGQTNDWATKNFYTVTEDFVTGVKSGGLYSSVDSFFKVSFSGSCPTYSAATETFGTITFDHWCRPLMNDIWPWVEAVILLLSGFVAFRTAFL